MATLELRGIAKRYESGAAALHPIDLTVEDGEMMVLVGPSGCGKSTLLRIVAGLVEPTEGEVRIAGQSLADLEPGARDVALVFQNYALYPHMSVRNNLAFPLRMRRMPRRERRSRVEEVAERLGLSDLLGRRPAQLSGGQMQRVALGRALVRRPRVFLFDESLSNLDARLRSDMRAEIRKLHADLGVTSLYVTHDQAEAMTLGQRVCVLDQGKISQVGPPLELHRSPATRFVADFLGSPAMNLMELPVDGGHVTLFGQRLAVPPGASDRGPLTLGLRPQEVRTVAHDAGGAPARVTDLERHGSTTLCLLSHASGQSLLAELPGDVDYALDAQVHVDLGTTPTHWFAADGRRIG